MQFRMWSTPVRRLCLPLAHISATRQSAAFFVHNPASFYGQSSSRSSSTRGFTTIMPEDAAIKSVVVIVAMEGELACVPGGQWGYFFQSVVVCCSLDSVLGTKATAETGSPHQPRLSVVGRLGLCCPLIVGILHPVCSYLQRVWLADLPDSSGKTPRKCNLT